MVLDFAKTLVFEKTFCDTLKIRSIHFSHDTGGIFYEKQKSKQDTPCLEFC